MSSASGMNSAGGMRPRPGWFQRTSASTATVSPVARSTIGWYWTISSRNFSARSSSSLRSWRRTIESRISGVKTAKRRLPPSLASYIATSASRSSSSACVRALWLAAMPIERLTLSGFSPAATGIMNDWSVRLAISTAPRSASSSRRTSTANSSPPSRATTSSRRTECTSRDATPRSSWSPIACPSVSLTPLKSSRSMNITATLPSASPSSASRTRWLNSARLASPVSGSWWAWCWSWSWRSRSSETACSRRSYWSAALALAASVSNSARSEPVKPRESP